MANEEAFARLVGNPAQELYEGLASYQQRLVMQVLAVFNAPVPATAVRYLLPALPVDELLDGLVHSYAVGYDHGLFSLHPLDQQYAYAQIPASGEEYSRPAMHSRAADYYRELGEGAIWRTYEDLEPPLQLFYHLLRSELHEAAANVLNQMDFRYLQKWGYSSVVIEMREQLLGKLSSEHSAIANLNALGGSYLEVARLGDAVQAYEEAARLCEQGGRPDTLRLVRNGLGMAYGSVGRLQEAQDCYRQNLEEEVQLNDLYGQANSLHNLGAEKVISGEAEEALELLTRSLDLDRRHGMTREVGVGLGNLGNAYMMLGDPLRAVELQNEAYAIACEVNDRMREGAHQGNLARALMDLGQFAEAEPLLEAAIEIARSIHDGRRLTLFLSEMGRLLALGARGAEAQCFLAEASRQAELIPYPRAQCRAAVGYGWMHMVAGDFPQALAAFERGAQICRRLGDQFELARNLRGLAQAHYYVGDSAAAEACCQDVLGLGIHTEMPACAVRLALAAMQAGDSGRARGQLAQGLQACGRQLERAAKSLDARYHYVLALFALRRAGEGLAETRALRADFSAPGFLGLLARDLEMLAQPGDAAAELTKAITMLQ